MPDIKIIRTSLDQLLEKIRDSIVNAALPEEVQRRIDRAPLNLNSVGFDPWGLHPETAKVVVSFVRWLYTHYFRVTPVGIGHVPQGRCLLIANHGGQVPIDGLTIGLSMLLDGNPPRVVRGMVERWVPSVPFVSSIFTRIGQVTGDPQNCIDLLEADECVLVFPEGVRGSGKPIRKAYQLQRFGTGFMRLALETQTPIVPVAVIGGEEAYPGLFNLKPLARLLRAPYFPVTPFFPHFGPLGAIPLPTKITLRFGKPLHFDGDPDAPDAEIEKLVEKVKSALNSEIQRGLKKRGKSIFRGGA